MRDPHVVSLHYRLVPASTVSYSAPMLEHEAPEFRMRLSESKIIFEMKHHYSATEEAQTVVERFLRAWEISALIDPGDEIAFEFENAELVDRDPPPPERTESGGIIHSAHMHAVVRATATLHAKITRGSYPRLPQFEATPQAEMMDYYYRRFKQGRERLSVVGYSILEGLYHYGGGKKNTPEKYNISPEVLRKLAALTSNKGGREESRKQPHSPPFTHVERVWIETTIKRLIEHADEARAHQLPMLTMADLPNLD